MGWGTAGSRSFMPIIGYQAFCQSKTASWGSCSHRRRCQKGGLLGLGSTRGPVLLQDNVPSK